MELSFYTDSPSVTFRLTYYAYFSEDTAFIVDDARLISTAAGTGLNLDFETGDLTGWTIVDSGDPGTQYNVVSPGLDGTDQAFRLDTTGAPIDGIEQTVQRGIFNECGINLLVTGEAGTTIRVEILDVSDSSLWASVQYTFDGSETEPVAFNSITGATFSLPAVYTIRLLYVQRQFESASATFDEVELALCL